MTFRRLRDWWARAWPDLTMAVYYVCTVVVGVVALLEDPSPAIQETLSAGAAAYAIGMILMGSCALVSLAARSRRSEAVCVGGMALLTGLHGAMILIASGPAGFVTGFRLGYAPLMMIVWCHLRTQTVVTRRQVQAHIDATERSAR